MVQSRPHAEVVHRMPHRARLRVLIEDGDDKERFERIARDLTQLPAVRGVRATARTGSLLIEHDGDLEPILAQAKQWLEIQPSSSRAPMRRIKRVLEEAEQRSSAQHDPLASLAFLALVGGSLYQAVRGDFLPAGLPLLGYALRVMDWAAEREPPLPDEG